MYFFPFPGFEVKRKRRREKKRLYKTLSLSLVKNEKTLKWIFFYILQCISHKLIQVSKTWAIGPRGLFYDREWLIMNSLGVPLTQKREPGLCQIKPTIDISNRSLILSVRGMPTFSLILKIPYNVSSLSFLPFTSFAYQL